MWYSVAFLGGSVAMVGGTYYTHQSTRPTLNVVQQLEQLKTISDVVKMLQLLANNRETDDMKSEIVDGVYVHGLSELCVIRLSKLHRIWGIDLGVRGYAITFIWSAIHEAFSHDRWQFISDTAQQ